MFTTPVSLRHTTMFTYSHATTPLGQSEHAYYLSYFIITHMTYGPVFLLVNRIALPQQTLIVSVDYQCYSNIYLDHPEVEIPSDLCS